MKGYKGFNDKLQCTPNGEVFKFELGQEYTHEGEVEACRSGFHFCENPLDVFGYYVPADSRYCEVEALGDIDKDGSDSKVATSKIKIKCEIGLPGLINAGVEYIKSKVDWENAKESNTGYRSAATNTGNYSAATNTGDYSAATNTGYRSAATNTGNQSAATNTGNYSAATVEGKESIAIATGIESKAKGALGCYIVVTEWELDNNYDWHLKDVQAAKVDGENIKADTFYILKDSKFVEV